MDDGPIQPVADASPEESPQPAPREPMFWTIAQRCVLIGLLSFLILFYGIRLTVNRTFVPDPQPPVPEGFADLQDRIDPNTADEATLSALPMIGPKRAATITTYRADRQAAHPDVPAFSRLEDLMRIKGIGPAIIAHLAPYMVFPATQQDTELKK